MNKREEIKKRIDLINKGEVPKGYKKNKGYIIPDVWDIYPAGNIFKNLSIKNTDNSEQNVLSVTQDRGVIHREDVGINIKYNEESLNSYKKVKKGNFIISLRSFQGGIEYSQYDGIVSPAYTILESILPINDYFYATYLKMDGFIKRLNTAIYGIRDGKQIDYDDFRIIPTIYPPTQEQEKIAEILKCCDKIIELKEKLLKKENANKKSLVKLLLDKNSIFNQTDLNYKTYKFQEVIEKVSSKSYQINSSEYLSEGKYPVVDQGKTKIIAYSNLSDKLFSCSNEGVIIFGDHTREVKFIDFDFIIGADGTQILKSKDKFNTKYIFYCICEYKIPNTGYNRHYKFLKEMKFVLPTIEKQTQIVKILSKYDKKIDLLQQELEQYKQLKKSLSQLLLTGIVRVNEV